MNFAVYFYNEEKRYTHMEMISYTYKDKLDEDGNVIGFTQEKVIPEGATDIAPPDLSTDPAFDKTAKEWVAQKPLPPYHSQVVHKEMLDKIGALSKEIETVKASVSEACNLPDVTPLEEQITKVNKLAGLVKSDIQDLRYNLEIAFPNSKHLLGEARSPKY